MDTIILPNGDKMPILGFGTSQALDSVALEAALEIAFLNGYRHFDTAFAYQNEKVLGNVIDRWITKGLVRRSELFITTKLPMNGTHPERVEMFLNKSLENLGLTYVDLYLIHFPVCFKYEEGKSFVMNDKDELQTEPTDHIAVWKKMEDMVDSGKTRSIGLSNFNISQISKILSKSRIKPANLQIESHPYLNNNELVEFCKERGISVVGFAPFGSPARNLHLKKIGWPTKEVPKLMDDPSIISIAKKYSRTPAQILLRFVIQRGLATIPKSLTPARIKENIDIFDFKLDATDMEKLRKLDRGNEGRMCYFILKGLAEHPEYPYK